MGLRLITAPTEYPVTVDEAMDWIHETDRQQEARVAGLIASGTAQAENYTGRRLITQTWDYLRDAFPRARCIEIPFPLAPVQSIDGVYYTPDGQAETEFPSASYVADTDGPLGRVVLRPTTTWPTDQLAAANGVRVRVTIGYGAAADVPEPFKTAIKVYVANDFDNPGSVVIGAGVSEIPGAMASKLGPYVIF